MSVWDNEYYEDEPEGYGVEPDPDDPLGILRADRDAELNARVSTEKVIHDLPQA